MADQPKQLDTEQPRPVPPALARALRRAQLEAEAFAREQQEAIKPEDHQAPWRQLMKGLGRL